ncbi:LysR family transcriptional regulator [Devosia sp.]|uniref:LysR family transcriptional regulator n=1 Tax=Devosia sp. TaxID=1871048 RepID=UPI003A918F2C
MIALDPDYLRSFLAISDTGSYGAAAERVNKTQSTVSAQMKRLEELLAVALFEKSGRRNLLTPEGLRLREYARSIVWLNEETVNAFRPAAPAGTIKVGMCDDYAQAFLMPVLARFTQRFPQVEIEVLTADTRSLRDRPDLDSFDVLIVSANSGMDGLEVLRRDRLHWIGPEDSRVHLEARVPLALWSEGCSWRGMGLTALAREGRDYRIVHTTSNAPLLRAFVREGLAVTIGPKWYLAEGLTILKDMDRVCPLGEDGLAIKVMATEMSEPLECFVDNVRAALRGDGQFLG